MAAASVRIRADQLVWLNERADLEGSSVSELVRDAVDGLMKPRSATLAGVEFDRVDDRVVVTIATTDGWKYAAAIDAEQAVEWGEGLVSEGRE